MSGGGLSPLRCLKVGSGGGSGGGLLLLLPSSAISGSNWGYSGTAAEEASPRPDEWSNWEFCIRLSSESDSCETNNCLLANFLYCVSFLVIYGL